MSENNDQPFSEAFYITLFGMFGASLALLLRACLSSRCSSIKCCGQECEREVLTNVDVSAIEVDARAV